MTKVYTCLTVVALLIAPGAFATEHNHPPNWTIECNQHGLIIIMADGHKIYIGKDGDIFVPGHGSGVKRLAASGFVIEAGSFAVRFNADPPECPPHG